MSVIVAKRETSLFAHGTDGSSKCLECGDFAVFPYQATSELQRFKLLNAHNDIHKYEGDEADSAVTKDHMVAQLYEDQVEKMGALIDEPAFTKNDRTNKKR
jgi:hypothetical protein